MKKKLLLVTDGFPFRPKEEGFLSTELNILCESFDVTIVALTAEDKQVCRVPEGVKFYNLGWSKYQLLANTPALLSRNCRLEVERAKAATSSNPVAVRRLRRHELIAAHYEKWLLEFIKKTGCQLIYTYWCTSATLAAVRIKCKHPEFGLKVISRFHGYDLYNDRTEGADFQPYRTEVSEGLDKLVFISEAGMKYYQDNWSVDKAKCLVSYLGTSSYDRLMPYSMAPEQADTDTDSDTDSDAVHTIVSCSDCIPLKRIDAIIDALSAVDKCRLHWIHLGKGMMLTDLQSKAEAMLAAKPNITYSLLGWVNHDDIHDIYAKNKAELFITLSENEGLPISVTEALAMGLPVIATDVGGMRELINKDNGYLVDVDTSAGEIAHQLEEHFSKSKEAINSMSDSAYALWNDRFNAAVNSDNFIKILCDL